MNFVLDASMLYRGVFMMNRQMKQWHSEKLTTYDAAYLELAMRLGVPLATKDHDLQHAAKKKRNRVDHIEFGLSYN